MISFVKMCQRARELFISHYDSKSCALSIIIIIIIITITMTITIVTITIIIIIIIIIIINNLQLGGLRHKVVDRRVLY